MTAANPNGGILTACGKALQWLRKCCGGRIRTSDRLAHFLDCSYDWEYWTDAAGSLLEMNHRGKEMTEYPVSAFLADPQLLEALVHPEDREHYRLHTSEMLTSAANCDLFEFRILTRTGKVRYLEHACRPVHTTAGSYLGRRVSNRDVSARKRIQYQLEEAERVAGIGYWTIDLNDGAIYWSQQTYRIFGVDPQAAMTLRLFSDCIHPDDRERAAKAWNDALSNRGLYEIEHRITVEGNTRWIRQRSDTAVQNGSVIIGTVMDITAQKLAQQALLASELRFKEILSGVDTVAVQGYNMDGTVSYWNRASNTFYGYSEQEAMGRNLLDLIIPDAMKEIVRREIQLMSMTGKPMPSGELTLQRKDGSPITVFSSHCYVEVPGKGAELFCIDVDLSYREQADEELRKINRQLELETQRANLLAEHADAANRAKSEFLANMSHEIRTPMNGVIGMAEILLYSDPNPQQRKLTEQLLKSADSLMVILNDILDYSKIEAGQLVLENVMFDVRKLLQEICGDQVIRATAKGLQLHSSCDASVPQSVCGDPNRLRQILNNLMGNAIKFTQSGSVSVTVQLRTTAADSSALEFRICDTGIGIAEDKQAELFTRFQQVDGSITRRYGGTGLGLAISRQLVELMGGQIGLHSKPGTGSTFFFTLPLSGVSKFPRQGASLTPDAAGTAEMSA